MVNRLHLTIGMLRFPLVGTSRRKTEALDNRTTARGVRLPLEMGAGADGRSHPNRGGRGAPIPKQKPELTEVPASRGTQTTIMGPTARVST